MWRFLFVQLCISGGFGFNIDTSSAVVYQGAQDSWFGFSVAAHRDQDTGWVLVGAPEADTEQKRWGVEKPGAVFRCETNLPYRCDVIPFDMTGNNNDTGVPIDEKSNQWFGATVSSSGENGVVVACAPRYVYFSINKRRREPVGTCFTAMDSFSRFSEYSPCRTAAWGYHRQGYCQAGFAAAATKERLFIGTPGSYYWQGQTYSMNLLNRLDLFSTEEGPESEDNTYLGYSLALGHFNGDSYPDIAVGMPRGSNLTGKVIFLTGTTMEQLHNLTGNQVGAYFGHAVAVSDVNGDGLDDVIIGAPMHTDFSLTDGRYETGRIYVVYQNKEHKFRRWHIRDGKQTKERFGFSLANLGDIDKDGYGDFAVGAPYAGPQGEGTVYIFRGSKGGVRERADQVIFGGSVRQNIRSFGFSLAGGVDMDTNLYPDLVVGAAHSNQAVLLRSRPVVNLEAEVKFITDAGKIDMGSRDCVISTGESVSCVPIKTCLRYTGVGVEKKIAVSVKLELDTKKQLSSRMFFLSREEESVWTQDLILTKEVPFCKSYDVYLIPNIRDKLTALEAKLNCQLPGSEAMLSPVLGLSSLSFEYYSTAGEADDIGLVTRDSVNIQKDCGEDNVCIPDLKIIYSRNLNEYSVGSDERLEISMEIINEGEDAYEANFFLDLPESINYIKTELREAVSEGLTYGTTPPVLCSPPTLRNEHVLKCDLGNPMAGNSKVSFRILLQPTVNFLEDVSSFEMSLAVNSSNPDSSETSADNHAQFSLPVRVKTDLRIRGLPVPNLVTYNKTSYEIDDEILDEADIGPEVTHIYQVENRGPSDIEEAEVYILWPSFRQLDDPLLYLTAQPQIEGPGRCQYVSDVNTHNIKIDRFRNAYSPLPNVAGINSKYSEEEDYEIDENFTEHDELFDVETEVLTPGTVRQERSIETSGKKLSPKSAQINRETDTEFLAELNCGLTQCTFISCAIGPLAKKEFTLFKVKSRLWVRTLNEIQRNDIEISSKLVSRVTKLPYGVNPSYLGYQTHVVTTQVLAHDLPVSGSIPLWILILAILAGFLFLSLLTYILYKLGFFQRKRPEDYDYQGTIQEKKPLGKESKNQLIPTNPHHSLIVTGSNSSSSSQRFSQSSNPRFSSVSNGYSNGGSVYYPGQRHPDMLPGDEAL